MVHKLYFSMIMVQEQDAMHEIVSNDPQFEVAGNNFKFQYYRTAVVHSKTTPKGHTENDHKRSLRSNLP